MTTPQRLTKLEAVNIMLDTIGEAPVNSLTGTLTADVAKAKSTLEEINKRVQNQGWHFNTEYDYTLTPDAITNRIAIPVNVVKVDADKTSYDITLRWDETNTQFVLYDKRQHSWEFTNSIEACLTYIFDFDHIPEAAKWYITVKAARIFQNRTVGDEMLYQFTKEDEMEALSDLELFEADTADHSIFHSYDTYRIIER